MKGAGVVFKGWLGGCLFLLVFTLPGSAIAQGSPDIVWMAGGHTDGVRSVAFSPDGSILASGSQEAKPGVQRQRGVSLLAPPLARQVASTPIHLYIAYGFR